MRPLSRLAALFFAAFAVVHLIRIFQGWEAVIGGTTIPMWVSYAAVAICGLLAYGIWREAGKKPAD